MTTTDTRKLYHRVDPLSSKLAIERHDRGARSGNLRTVYRLVRDWPGRTSAELCKLNTVLDKHEIRRRLTDLLHTGDVQQRDSRKCHVAHTLAVTWWPAEAKRV